ncbi:Imm8 family immunity protein [Snodgrassella communis]|uniref:Imm8 family immunity protein n=1 Tax=Snodgrassella communis TaxID=2946699 RepID=UPI001EF4E037|nr:Imm8 family immunity protein [Snodgrassella communis]
MKIKQQKFEVKYYWSPDIYDPWQWRPNDNSVFYLLEMNIGITGDNKSDIYSIIIATPEGIINLNKDKVKLPKLYKILLLNQYDWDKVRSAIDEKLAYINPSDGQQAFDKLASSFYWEYENMT